MKLLVKVCPSITDGIFSQIKNELDNEYHGIITESEFDEYGHIYYSLDERYKKIKQAE
jgi:hypothetical protein